MVAFEQPCYTLLCTPSEHEPPNEIQLKRDLEFGDTDVKIRVMKRIIRLIASGERLPALLMHVIRFVMPSQDHTIKKLLCLFWEIVPKTNSSGELLQEMIFVCDSYTKDLKHPNEYVRGSTLRFLCKLKEPELLGHLMPAIEDCLNHKIPYVRRNAILAIFTIHKSFEFLIPDGPEMVAALLEREVDMSCKRNAFLMLLHTDQEKALMYLVKHLDEVQFYGEILQLVIVEFINKVCRTNPVERSRFFPCIYNLLRSNSGAVRYDAATTLVSLSNTPTAVKAAVSCYIELIRNESDNNIKLIVLDSLIRLKKCSINNRVLEDLMMDLLCVLGCSDYEVKQKTLGFALDLVTSCGAAKLVSLLQKEVDKIRNCADYEDAEQCSLLFIKSLHFCSLNFPNVSQSVTDFLMELLSEPNESVSFEVILIVKETIERYDDLKCLIISKLLRNFGKLKSPRVHRAGLWLIGEYAASSEQIREALNLIKEGLGKFPFLGTPDTKKTDNIVERTMKSITCSKLGTSIFPKEDNEFPLLKYMINGDVLIGSCVASSVAKLAFRYKDLVKNNRMCYKFLTECILVISFILSFCNSYSASKILKSAHYERLLFCVRIVVECNPSIARVFLTDCHNSLKKLLASKKNDDFFVLRPKDNSLRNVDVDDPILILETSSVPLAAFDKVYSEDMFENSQISGNFDHPLGSCKLNVVQLTGFSDPVYAEADVNFNEYDITLQVMLLNQTVDTLQNCIVELTTLGDLKLVEKPYPCVLAPYGSCIVKISFKVNSTENSIIFGNIAYDVVGTSNVVVLSDIHLDILNYILPTRCSDDKFRKLWAEFEWENCISVTCQGVGLEEYLDQVARVTNMDCLNKDQAVAGSCAFLAANMYARSVFGEEVLGNVCVEVDPPAAGVKGHVRLRARSQGMALSLGDKIKRTLTDCRLSKGTKIYS